MSAEGNTGKGHFPAMQVAGEVETGSRHFFLLEVVAGAVAYLPFRGQGKVAVDTHHLRNGIAAQRFFGSGSGIARIILRITERIVQTDTPGNIEIHIFIIMTVQSIVLFLFVFPVVRRELYARRSRYAGQTSDASIVPVDSDGIGIDGIRV